MEKSYTIVYQDDIVKALKDNGIDKYMVLNNQLTIIYTDENFDELILDKIPEVSWWQEADPMSSLVQIGKDLNAGETVSEAAGVAYVDKNPYISATGKGVIIGIIDSGIDYLHPDFINNDNTSRIISIWDQEGNTKPPPEGFIFGSEFTREDINEAIANNNGDLTKDNIGTGTIVAGIAAGNGRKNPLYRGVATESELVVVKLKEYRDTFTEGRINYMNTDFLAAIKYIRDIGERENKLIIINLSIGERPRTVILTNLLDTFDFLTNAGVVLVSGAGNEGNTNIHYEGTFKNNSSVEDIIVEVGEQKSLIITICPNGPDKYGVQVISPSGELSYDVAYTPDEEIYEGKFNLEDSSYTIQIIYPWILSGNEEGIINIVDIKPGIWTFRISPELVVSGQFDIYLPNGNLLPKDTGFLDPNSFATITLYGCTERCITVGAFNDKTNSMWIGSSKGPIRSKNTIKPDIVAPGVDLIAPFINQTYIKSTGTGVSAALTSGVLALIMQYIDTKKGSKGKLLFTSVLKTYLCLGATKDPIYTFPNDSQGYGVLNLEQTINTIADKI